MIDGRTGLNPAYAEKNANDWVVASTGTKPEPHQQVEPNITHFVDVIDKIVDSKQRDAEEIRRQEQKSLIDDLTQCFNSKYFNKFADEIFDPNRDHNRIGIVNIDINGLKQVNDILGHAKGDILLTSFVSYMKSRLRKGDILVRLHGDEFLIICENTTNEPKFQEILQARMDEISKDSPKSSILEENISFAHGVSVYRRFVHKDLNDTAAAADHLMYECKRKMKAEANAPKIKDSEKTKSIPVKEIMYIIEKTAKEINRGLRRIFKGE